MLITQQITLPDEQQNRVLQVKRIVLKENRTTMLKHQALKTKYNQEQ
jgi:hypothetical protein